jgi:hypothetical protein
VNRRSPLRASLTGALLPVSGCLWFDIEGRRGVNKRLRLTNNSDTGAELHVVVHRDGGSDSDTKVFERDVDVPPGETEVREVLGDHQYRITVSGRRQTIEFSSRPICDHARTEVFVTGDDELRFEVDWCE